MPRKQSDTSRKAYDYIMRVGGINSHYKKIVLALEWLGSGNNWEIAKQANLKPEQTWKRTGELCQPDPVTGIPTLIDTGKESLNPDGNMAIIYCLYQDREEYASKTPKERYNPNEDKAHEYIDGLIEIGMAKKKFKEKYLDKKLSQADLFGEEK